MSMPSALNCTASKWMGASWRYFIASQKAEGWMMARERYDDGTDSIKLGKEACEACRVPAGEIEGVVVKQLRGVLRSP
jgi:hypothetical protein